MAEDFNQTNVFMVALVIGGAILFAGLLGLYLSF